jgi:hypothetical protein
MTSKLLGHQWSVSNINQYTVSWTSMPEKPLLSKKTVLRWVQSLVNKNQFCFGLLTTDAKSIWVCYSLLIDVDAKRQLQFSKYFHDCQTLLVLLFMKHQSQWPLKRSTLSFAAFLSLVFSMDLAFYSSFFFHFM